MAFALHRGMTSKLLIYSGEERLGDGIMKLPWLASVRATYPDAAITWLAGQGRSIFAHELAPLLQEWHITVIDTLPCGRSVKEWLHPPVLREAYDIIIDTQTRLRPALSVRRVRHKIFISGAANFLLSSRRPPRGLTVPRWVLARLDLLLALASGRAVTRVFTPLQAPAAYITQAAGLLPAGDKYIGLVVGAGGAHKRWPLDNFIALAQQLTALGWRPCFILGPQETADAGMICARLPDALLPLQQAPAHPLLTLALGARLRAAVAADCGGGHLLAAAGVPLVSLFGATAPEKFAPYTKCGVALSAAKFGGTTTAAIPVGAVLAALQGLIV